MRWRSAGVAIETSCRAGLCGTCKVRYLSGEVEHSDCILGDDEKSTYLRHACRARPRGAGARSLNARGLLVEGET